MSEQEGKLKRWTRPARENRRQDLREDSRSSEMQSRINSDNSDGRTKPNSKTRKSEKTERTNRSNFTSGLEGYQGIDHDSPERKLTQGGKLITDDELAEKRRARFARKNDDKGTYGYISRGEDSRLQVSSKEREAYFDHILRQFIRFCRSESSVKWSSKLADFIEVENFEKTSRESKEEGNTVTIDSILSSLRKLREALLHSSPTNFTKRVFLFSIRVSTAAGHYHTYVSSILFLLRSNLLERAETIEISTLLIIHLSHFNNRSTEALSYYFKYLPGQDVLNLLKSWIHKDYHTWIGLYNKEADTSRFRLMQFGLSVMINAFTQSISCSYYNYKKPDLEQILPNGMNCEELLSRYRVQWRIDGSNIVIKERRI